MLRRRALKHKNQCYRSVQASVLRTVEKRPIRYRRRGRRTTESEMSFARFFTPGLLILLFSLGYITTSICMLAILYIHIRTWIQCEGRLSHIAIPVETSKTLKKEKTDRLEVNGFDKQLLFDNVCVQLINDAACNII